MQVRSLRSADEFDRYVDFAQEVYRDSPQWVPPDVHHLTSLLAGQKEAGPHWHVQPFWVESEGRILATLTAVVDELYNRHWNERTGHLLFFEALPDRDAGVAALFRTACDWLPAQGCQAARASFLYGWQLPWTIDAYDVVPTVFHTYNPPYYHSYAKNAGFRTEHGMVQYQIAFTPELATRYREMVARVGAAGVALRHWNFDRLDEESALFGQLLNETFAGHWGSPQYSPAQMRGFAVGMKDLLVSGFSGLRGSAGRGRGVRVLVARSQSGPPSRPRHVCRAKARPRSRGPSTRSITACFRSSASRRVTEATASISRSRPRATWR